MASYIRQRPAGWFTLAAVLLALWGAMGCAALCLHVAYAPALDAAATDWDRSYYAALPGWFTPVYAVAVGAGLLGSFAMLMRSKMAKSLYSVSLAAVIVQFGYVFAGTDLIAHKGAAATVPFPLIIAAIAGAQIWFAAYAERRGWIS